MSSDPFPVLGFDIVVDAIRLGVRVGRLYHFLIETTNCRIDRWLWDCDWAWANDHRYRSS